MCLLDFLDEDWFIIVIEIIFLIFISFDIRRYMKTKKREYIVNIVLTSGFFIWAAMPFYNSYYTWKNEDKILFTSECNNEINVTLCECLDNKVFKEYSFNTYKKLKQTNDSELIKFINKTNKECLDD